MGISPPPSSSRFFPFIKRGELIWGALATRARKSLESNLLFARGLMLWENNSLSNAPPQSLDCIPHTVQTAQPFNPPLDFIARGFPLLLKHVQRKSESPNPDGVISWWGSYFCLWFIHVQWKEVFKWQELNSKHVATFCYIFFFWLKANHLDVCFQKGICQQSKGKNA